MADRKTRYPCGGFDELQQIPPGQSTDGYFPCLFNDVQHTCYICPADDEYPRICQEVYKDLTALIVEAHAFADQELAKIEAEKRAKMSLKDKVISRFKKEGGEDEPGEDIQSESL